MFYRNYSNRTKSKISLSIPKYSITGLIPELPPSDLKNLSKHQLENIKKLIKIDLMQKDQRYYIKNRIKPTNKDRELLHEEYNYYNNIKDQINMSSYYYFT